VFTTDNVESGAKWNVSIYTVFS